MEYSAPLFRIFNYDKIWTTFEPWNNQDPWHVMNPKASNPHLSSTSPSSRNSSWNIVIASRFATERSIFSKGGFQRNEPKNWANWGRWIRWVSIHPVVLWWKKEDVRVSQSLVKFLKDPIFLRNLRTASGFRLHFPPFDANKNSGRAIRFFLSQGQHSNDPVVETTSPWRRLDLMDLDQPAEVTPGMRFSKFSKGPPQKKDVPGQRRLFSSIQARQVTSYSWQ